jgi:hypothetical protein
VYERPPETSAQNREWTRPSINGDKIRHSQNVRPFFDLLAEDSQLNVYAGELEVRPPRAPTTKGYCRRKAAAVRAGSNVRNRLDEDSRLGGARTTSLPRYQVCCRY